MHEARSNFQETEKFEHIGSYALTFHNGVMTTSQIPPHMYTLHETGPRVQKLFIVAKTDHYR